MADSKHTGRWKRFAFALLGRSRGRKILADIVRKQTAQRPLFSFPLDAAAVKSVVIILPPDRLQVLHQLKNVAALKSFFHNAEVTLVSEAGAAPLARLLHGVHVVEYPIEEKRLFSAAFAGFTRQFSGAVEVCCLLTRTEDLPLLYLAGRTGAMVRAGYQGAGIFPFINLHVNPSADRRYAADWNLALAEMLGAKKVRDISWAVTKQTEAEIDHLLREVRCAGPSRLAGIDALFLYRALGAGRAAECIRTIEPVVKERLYLYAEKTGDAAEMQWLLQFNLPLIYNISVPQVAALLSRSDLVVTGNTLLFGLAVLLNMKAVGIFDKKEIDACCPGTPMVRGIVYQASPGNETVSGITKAVAELVA
jgi:ADP-heptose:LPS heptosyltransferase